MWRYRYAFVCAIGALLACAVLLESNAAAADPSTLPLIQFADLIYTGAFRLPKESINGDSFTQSGTPMAYNPGRNSLFVGNRANHIAEVDIPAPVNSADVNALPFAKFLQAFADPTEGNLFQVARDGVALSGIMVSGDKLYGAASIYYDADNLQRVSHFSHSTNLSQSSFMGMKQLWEFQKTGFVSGFMSAIPAEWQSLLGGTAISGQCCLPITWRTSQGPAAFAWNPAGFAAANPVPATPLLYYPYDHTTLGRWDSTNSTYGGSTEIGGFAVLAGTRTVLYFGRNGTGAFCYGNGTGNASLVGTIGPDNEKYCYDPTNTAKGQHAWPYNYQIWAYDLNELAAVKAGTKQPWDVRPYGVWPFRFPFDEPTVRIGGIGYDASRQLIYVTQMLADQDGYEYRPIIHVLKVGGGAAGAPLPSADTTPLPPLPTPASTKATDVSIVADKAAPQAPGTTITFSATPVGGVTPHQYKWLVYDGVQWNAASGWSTSNAFAWTPSRPDSSIARYRVGVWVRSAGNNADTLEASSFVEFPISGSASSSPTPPPNSAKATGVALAANRTAPQPPGTTITFTASPSGGVSPYQYQWLVYDNVQWNRVGTWTASNTFAWTPSSANAGYAVGVWIRSAGNTSDTLEVSTSVPFAISGAATSAPPPSTPSAKATAVSIVSNLPSPQPAGTTITFSAAPSGGAAPHQYQWLIYDNVKWNRIGTWTASNTFAWTPSAANSGYQVGVWVRSNGNSSDTLEVSNSVPFVISAATSSPGASTPPASYPPPSTPTSRASSVGLTVSTSAPQAPGSTITFTASPVGGVAPYQYSWLVFDGLSWKTAISWTSSNTFAWTPGMANPDFHVGVWVRSAGNTANELETSASVPFPITGTLPAANPSTPPAQGGAATVTLAPSLPSPQVKGTPITFTAAPSGGTAPYTYKWYVWDGSTWLVVRGWSSANTYTWTPTSASPAYKVAVWVRSAGNAADMPENQAQLSYSVTSTATAGASAPAGSARVTSVTVGANRIAPQAPGTTMSFTAIATGGAGPLQYKWLVFDGYSWVPMGAWTTSSTFTWTPATRRADFRVGVWVKSAGNPADDLEASNSIAFPIQ